MKADFLFEIGSEELPPKSLIKLTTSLQESIVDSLKQANLDLVDYKIYATPRRMAIVIQGLDILQQDTITVLEGPALQIAYDINGHPTKALTGWAKKNAIDIHQIDKSGSKVKAKKEIKGKTTAEILPNIIINALEKLPVAKNMRWGVNRYEFVRPVKWLLCLFNEQILDFELFGLKTSNITYGHRIHAHAAIVINKAQEYEHKLEQAYVIADFMRRQEKIKQDVQNQAMALQAKVISFENILQEVTALVEFPQALTCSFDARFLQAPQESLIATMESNQKYFCLTDNENKLINKFIVISNIKSLDPLQVIHGNEKVITPRLEDAVFFFNQDKKQDFALFNEKLKNIIFQTNLGTVYQKTERISLISEFLADLLNIDTVNVKTAAQLCKADLATQIVTEFPEMQGIAGYYYAQASGLNIEIARAIREHYMPIGSNSPLASSNIGVIVAIADKIDTLVGIYGIGMKPTGSKDPYALRRSAIGIIRYLEEQNIQVNLKELLQQVAYIYKQQLKIDIAIEPILQYMLSRLQARYEENGINPQLFYAINNLQIFDISDFNKRILALINFISSPNSQTLANNNKRIANILSKDGIQTDMQVNEKLFTLTAEKQLWQLIIKHEQKIIAQTEAKQYIEVFNTLTLFNSTITDFFESVLVNSENIHIKNNRISLLQRLHRLFLQVADISELAI